MPSNVNDLILSIEQCNVKFTLSLEQEDWPNAVTCMENRALLLANALELLVDNSNTNSQASLVVLLQKIQDEDNEFMSTAQGNLKDIAKQLQKNK